MRTKNECKQYHDCNQYGFPYRLRLPILAHEMGHWLIGPEKIIICFPLSVKNIETQLINNYNKCKEIMLPQQFINNEFAVENTIF